MPGINLTRDEAANRAGLLEVSRYDVELDLTRGELAFGTTTTVRFGCRHPGATSWLDLVAPTVHEVVLNGRSLDPAEVFDGTRVQLPDLAADNDLRVVAEGAYTNTGQGLHRFVDPVDDEVYLYTQFEVADARRMFGCFEQPDLKAEFAFTVTAPAAWQVVSNSPTPDPEPADEGTATWRFPATPRLSTYVTALVAGPYTAVRGVHAGRGGDIPLGLFCRASLVEHLDADALFEITRQGFAYFEEAFDLPYPFLKYDQLFVPEFNAGAMENAGAVTFREDYIFRSRVTDAAFERRAETILHEMAHMWFGDLVTMRWWDDLWLNESFATWASVACQAEATRWRHAWTTFANTEKGWALRQDQLPSTHPVSADMHDLEDVEVNFDGITYAKGASVLKQLVAWVGREEFLAGLRAYFRRHAFGNATLADLFAALEETSGRDLSAWRQEWLLTAGVNTLRPEVDLGADGKYVSVAVLQSAGADHPTIRSHRIAVGLYDRESGGLVRRARSEHDVTGERTQLPGLAGVRAADLLLLNDDDLSFAKVRLDERSLRTLLGGAGGVSGFEESLPRALCWTAATDMLRDAELPARSYVDLVLDGVSAEGEVSVVQNLLATGRAAVDLYGNPDDRFAQLARWAAGTYALAHEAAAGSDNQLAFVRAWAWAADSPERVGELRDMLAGSASFPGLAVDTDLRWSIVQRLVALGDAGEAEIAAELERDDTATGRRQADLARAARPTAAAKAEAWRIAVEDETTPNAVMESVIDGFVQPDQRGLLAPYVEPYFAALPQVWAQRQSKVAQTIVVRLYPRLLADQALLERTDRFLADTDPPPALRRLVLEGRADVERALAAQACDRAAGHEESQAAGPRPPAERTPLDDDEGAPA